MKFTVLGSGTLLPDDRRHSPSHYLEAGEARVLLDCGAGTLHGLARHSVWWRGISLIALTHFHTDHVGDVAPLLFALRHGVRPPREGPLLFLGPPGLRVFLERLAAAHGEFVTDPGFPVEIVELPPGAAWSAPDGAFRIQSHRTPHTDSSVAYRLESGDGAVGYTGDTGPSDALGDFMAGVALLVSECSVADPADAPNHLSPSSVARLALRAAPDFLLITHLYPPLRPHKVPSLIKSAGYPGRVVVAKDGTTVEVVEGRAVLGSG